MNPLISVIVPAYNAEITLPRALESIIGQTYRTLEIIIVDDNSSDRTKEIAESYAARDPRISVISAPDDPYRYDRTLHRNVNAGWSARNAGLALARGEYITFQDSDDISLPSRIETQLELLRTHRAIHVTTSWLSPEHAPISTETTSRSMQPTLRPTDLYLLSQKTKGLISKISPRLNAVIPFSAKRWRVINKLFFGSLEAWPGAGNSPLFQRNVIEKVQFRPLKHRVWPSFMGRGADRDFNFQVAETFKNSYFFDIPLYLWDK